MKNRYGHLFIILCGVTLAEAKVYSCMDETGQRIFSDKPCSEVIMGEGRVGDAASGMVEIQKLPKVIDERAADRIRYRLTPAQAKAKYCAKYDKKQIDRFVLTKQVVLGMLLADVIKVWGAPLSSDGNKVLFQNGDDEVTVSLIEGCVINIQRHQDDEEYLEDQPIENNL